MLRSLNWIALVLVIVGGLNWGLVGLFDVNLVNTIFGNVEWLERTVYTLVGLAAAYMIYYAAVVEAHPHAGTETHFAHH